MAYSKYSIYTTIYKNIMLFRMKVLSLKSQKTCYLSNYLDFVLS